ncbi:AAA family ATPase [Fibrella sp. USSR17]
MQFNNISSEFTEKDGTFWVNANPGTSKPWRIYPEGRQSVGETKIWRAATDEEARKVWQGVSAFKVSNSTALEWIKKGIETEVAKVKEYKAVPLEHVGLFTVRTGNEWIEQAKTRPTPKMLFDAFWFENEICILFAGSNQGKSILAVQIADSISRGNPIRGFHMEAERQRVLYFDFELSDKQFETRYSADYTGHYSFDENFLRVEMNSDADTPTSSAAFDEMIIQSIEEAVLQHGVKVLIIDNLTFLRSTEPENAKEASPLMKQLKALKSKHNLSLLILAHTPKRDQSRPITQNDLQGSARLMQFTDSSFAIGASAKDNALKYLKQVKVRNTACVFDGDNVALCQIHKPDNFLHLDLIGFANEQEHLRVNSEKDTADQSTLIHELAKRGKTQRQIAVEANVSQSKVSRILKSYNEA